MIIAATAYPSYQEYVRKTRRIDMQANMLKIASDIQRYKIANFKVTGASASDFGIKTTYPEQGVAFYNVTLEWFGEKAGEKDPVWQDTGKLGSERWRLVATPISNTNQSNDGFIILNSKGERCWIKGMSACEPSAITNWDGK